MQDVAKFSYLKELVVPKVRLTIEKLPANSDGYDKAKKMLLQRYGDTSEVVNAHVSQILSLPVIHGTSRLKIHSFYDNLLGHVQALETLGKLGDVAGNVRLTLDKLEGIRGDLIRTEENWKKWTFKELVEALRLWVERNPLQHGDKEASLIPRDVRKDKLFAMNDHVKQRRCVYCDNESHRSGECDKVVDIDERKGILSKKKRCFNCTGEKHRASDCKSKVLCHHCQRRHHTSICNKDKPGQKAYCQPNVKNVVYPVVVVKVEGVKCRAVLDTGSGNTYASTTLIDLIGKKPVRQEFKTIEMMLHTTTKKISVYEVEITDVEGKFKMCSEVNQVDRHKLMSLPNPKYKELIAKHEHLKGVRMSDEDSKSMLPVHLILGASEISRIKTSTPAKVGGDGEPVAEKTSLGWTIMSPGCEMKHSQLLIVRNSHDDYLQLCSLDVLGLEDKAEGDQESVYQEFKEQLTQREDGKYETSLTWKATHPELPTNQLVAQRRLQSLLKRLEKQPGLLKKYDHIMKDQLGEGIVEVAPENPGGTREHYLPHKPVVREQAESTKVRIVFDASSKANESYPSLNDCLDIGPPLQRRILDILLRSRLKPVFLAGDVKQAFLQIVIREVDRDAMRFLWINDLQHKETVVYRMTRAMFGLGPSPFLLGGTLQVHLQEYAQEFPNCVRELIEGTYVDDLNIGGDTVMETGAMKEQAKKILGEGSFELHKWHSNVKELESNLLKDGETTYAKESLGTKPSETKLLGLGWQKDEDTLSVAFPQPEDETTKRGVLRTLAKVYDPLGIAAPILLTAKVIFRDICDQKLGWDANLPNDLRERWARLPRMLTVPRSICRERAPTTEIVLHGFADASILGCCAVVFAIVKQGAQVSQGFLVSKARLAKRDLTIPRLELIACHMFSNLLHNTSKVLSHLPVTSVHAWTDSTVCLQWIKGLSNYKQFIVNRVRKINEKQALWKYVPTDQNPADIGTRGATRELQIKVAWMKGPPWLSQSNEWPKQINAKPTEASENESRLVKSVMQMAVQMEQNGVENLLSKFKMGKVVRILAWIKRFIGIYLLGEQHKGPLGTEETERQLLFLIQRVQVECEELETFKQDSTRLNLQKNDEGTLVCKGRIQGEFPVSLPAKHLLSERIVDQAHRKTLHGGVGLTMSKVREDYWIPKLRSITKKVIRKCYGCKRFHTLPVPAPPQGNLPKERTEGTTPFGVVGVDYAGPIYYRHKKTEHKSYIILYTCSLTRGVHLELLPNMSCEEFLASLKRFVAARGRPKKIISDNGKTFHAASKWIKKATQEERFHNFLDEHKVKWQFNLSKASWWVGMFERMVGLVKNAFYKVVGSAKLTYKELQDVLLDVQIVLNNRPLTYCEDDVQLPVLTPNIMIFGKANYLLELPHSEIKEKDLRKRAKYLAKCKESLWRRWRNEYLRALRERHNLQYDGKQRHLKEGDMVLIKGEEKNRGKWKIGVVYKLVPGRDGIVRVVRLRAGKSYLERPRRFLYPMDLHCNLEKQGEKEELNPQAREFTPKRKAAIDATKNIQELFEVEEMEL